MSTEGQVDSGVGLAAQLTAEAERQGWALEVHTDAGLSGTTPNRPALAAALDALDRVSRGCARLRRVMHRARRPAGGPARHGRHLQRPR